MPRATGGIFHRARTYVAFFSLGILNLRAVGLDWRNVCSYGFNCHGCPHASFACPVGVLAYGSAVRTLPALALALVLAVGIGLGRLVCGYACPFGLLQDLLHRIPSPKLWMPRPLRYLKYVMLALLVFLFPYLLSLEPLGYLEAQKPVIEKTDDGLNVTVEVVNRGTTDVVGVDLISVYRNLETGERTYRADKPIRFADVVVAPGASVALGPFPVPNQLADSSLAFEMPQSRIVQTPRYGLYFCKVCPNGTLTAHLPGYFGADVDADGVYGRAGQNAPRLVILALVIVLAVLISRFFCRALCPLGAMYALASPLAITRVQVDRTACVSCGLCDRVCPVELNVQTEAGSPECIACGDCIGACPKGLIARTIGLSDMRRRGETAALGEGA